MLKSWSVIFGGLMTEIPRIFTVRTTYLNGTHSLRPPLRGAKSSRPHAAAVFVSPFAQGR